jgi:hypothetical protein
LLNGGYLRNCIEVARLTKLAGGNMTALNNTEKTPEQTPELSVEDHTPLFVFGMLSGWGLMARQLKIEEEESFNGARSTDKMLAKFSDIDPDETFRL